MVEETNGLPKADAGALGSSLGPVLIEQCGGRLSEIEWFRSTWQRGGAATGFAHWRAEDGKQLPAVVKFPVTPVEHRWTTQLGDARGSVDEARSLPTARVFAAGRTLRGYDLAWLVTERLEGHTLSANWGRQALEDLLRAAAEMQARALATAPVSGASTADFDWEEMVGRSRDAARASDLPEAQRWNDALRRVQKSLPGLQARWSARGLNTWCHGDLHPGNAMRRPGAESTPTHGCVLIDLALVHPGHWVEDAVYLERQFWSHPELLHGINPVSLLAKYRRELGLPTDGDYGMVANLRRVLKAACVPAQLDHEGSLRYAHAALEMLERVFPQVAR